MKNDKETKGRRDFLCATGTALAGLASLSVVAVCSARKRKKSKLQQADRLLPDTGI